MAVVVVVDQISAATERRNYCSVVVARVALPRKTGLQMGQIRMMLGPDVCCVVAMAAAGNHRKDQRMSFAMRVSLLLQLVATAQD